MGQEDPELKLVLLGKTGAGKSASGNTILGKKAFFSQKSSKSITKEVNIERSRVCGKRVAVYDTPGFFDTQHPEEEIKRKCQQLIETCKSGPCVFLVVIKTDRFTQEEKAAVQKIRALLDEQQLKQSWILFTRGDELEDQTIEEFIDETNDLKEVVKQFGSRYHVFSNTIKDMMKKKIQVRQLLNKVCRKFQNHFNLIRPRENPAFPLPERRIVLLGKTGVGKSATGNTILGKKEFRSQKSFNSVTTKCKQKMSVVSEHRVSVIDTPGFFDTKMSRGDLAKEIGKSIYISRPGPHAFLLVLPIGRFTEQELEIIKLMETVFGPGAREYTIILFTHGEQVKPADVEKQIKENCALHNLVETFGGRYQVFSNEKMKDRDQVTELMEKIDRMLEKNGGNFYTSEMYEDAVRAAKESEMPESETSESNEPQSETAESNEPQSETAESNKPQSKTAESNEEQSKTAESEEEDPPEDEGFCTFLLQNLKILLGISFAIIATAGVGAVAGAVAGAGAGAVLGAGAVAGAEAGAVLGAGAGAGAAAGAVLGAVIGGGAVRGAWTTAGIMATVGIVAKRNQKEIKRNKIKKEN